MIFPNPIRAAGAFLRGVWWKLRGYRVLVAERELEHRRAICECCQFEVRGQCLKCSCFTVAKTALASEECPVGKWHRIKAKKNLTGKHPA